MRYEINSMRLWIFAFRDLSVENLRYLTSEQALADLATFREYFNEKYQIPKQTKWISFGGSYPGYLFHFVFSSFIRLFSLFKVHYQHGFV